MTKYKGTGYQKKMQIQVAGLEEENKKLRTAIDEARDLVRALVLDPTAHNAAADAVRRWDNSPDVGKEE